jgi:hypothetical protein
VQPYPSNKAHDEESLGYIFLQTWQQVSIQPRNKMVTQATQAMQALRLDQEARFVVCVGRSLELLLQARGLPMTPQTIDEHFRGTWKICLNALQRNWNAHSTPPTGETALDIARLQALAGSFPLQVAETWRIFERSGPRMDIAPQHMWRMFVSPYHLKLLRAHGIPASPMLALMFNGAGNYLHPLAQALENMQSDRGRPLTVDMQLEWSRIYLGETYIESGSAEFGVTCELVMDEDCTAKGISELQVWLDELNEEYGDEGLHMTLTLDRARSDAVGAKVYRFARNPVSGETLRAIMQRLLDDYTDEIKVANRKRNPGTRSDARVKAIADYCHKQLAFQPLGDGNTRLNSILLLNDLLHKEGEPVTRLFHDSMLFGCDLDKICQAIRDGQRLTTEQLATGWIGNSMLHTRMREPFRRPPQVYAPFADKNDPTHCSAKVKIVEIEIEAGMRVALRDFLLKKGVQEWKEKACAEGKPIAPEEIDKAKVEIGQGIEDKIKEIERDIRADLEAMIIGRTPPSAFRSYVKELTADDVPAHEQSLIGSLGVFSEEDGYGHKGLFAGEVMFDPGDRQKFRDGHGEDALDSYALTVTADTKGKNDKNYHVIVPNLSGNSLMRINTAKLPDRDAYDDARIQVYFIEVKATLSTKDSGQRTVWMVSVAGAGFKAHQQIAAYYGPKYNFDYLRPPKVDRPQSESTDDTVRLVRNVQPPFRIVKPPLVLVPGATLALLEQGRQVLDEARRYIDSSANQAIDVVRTEGRCRGRFWRGLLDAYQDEHSAVNRWREMVRTDRIRPGSTEKLPALWGMALAIVRGGGATCEEAAIVTTALALVRGLHAEHNVALAADMENGHYVTVIGSLKEPHAVVIDAWPVVPTVCTLDQLRYTPKKVLFVWKAGSQLPPEIEREALIEAHGKQPSDKELNDYLRLAPELAVHRLSIGPSLVNYIVEEEAWRHQREQKLRQKSEKKLGAEERKELSALAADRLWCDLATSKDPGARYRSEEDGRILQLNDMPRSIWKPVDDACDILWRMRQDGAKWIDTTDINGLGVSEDDDMEVDTPPELDNDSDNNDMDIDVKKVDTSAIGGETLEREPSRNATATHYHAADPAIGDGEEPPFHHKKQGKDDTANNCAEAVTETALHGLVQFKPGEFRDALVDLGVIAANHPLTDGYGMREIAFLLHWKYGKPIRYLGSNLMTLRNMEDRLVGVVSELANHDPDHKAGYETLQALARALLAQQDDCMARDKLPGLLAQMEAYVDEVFPPAQVSDKTVSLTEGEVDRTTHLKDAYLIAFETFDQTLRGQERLMQHINHDARDFCILQVRYLDDTDSMGHYVVFRRDHYVVDSLRSDQPACTPLEYLQAKMASNRFQGFELIVPEDADDPLLQLMASETARIRDDGQDDKPSASTQKPTIANQPICIKPTVAAMLNEKTYTAKTLFLALVPKPDQDASSYVKNLYSHQGSAMKTLDSYLKQENISLSDALGTLTRFVELREKAIRHRPENRQSAGNPSNVRAWMNALRDAIFDLPALAAGKDLQLEKRGANFGRFDEHCASRQKTFFQFENDVRVASELTRTFLARNDIGAHAKSAIVDLLHAKHGKTFPHPIEDIFALWLKKNPATKGLLVDTHRQFGSVMKHIALYMVEHDLSYEAYKENPRKYRREIETNIPPHTLRKQVLDLIEEGAPAWPNESRPQSHQSLLDYGLSHHVYDENGKRPDGPPPVMGLTTVTATGDKLVKSTNIVHAAAAKAAIKNASAISDEDEALIPLLLDGKTLRDKLRLAFPGDSELACTKRLIVVLRYEADWLANQDVVDLKLEQDGKIHLRGSAILLDAKDAVLQDYLFWRGKTPGPLFRFLKPSSWGGERASDATIQSKMIIYVGAACDAIPELAFMKGDNASPPIHSACIFAFMAALKDEKAVANLRCKDIDAHGNVVNCPELALSAKTRRLILSWKTYRGGDPDDFLLLFHSVKSTAHVQSRARSYRKRMDGSKNKKAEVRRWISNT